MIYTIGNKEICEALFDKHGEGKVFKRGRTLDYEGGWVFRTEQEARDFFTLETYEVYRVMADWNVDVRACGSKVGYLLRDALMYRLGSNVCDFLDGPE
jgi:hypothetical protein